MYSSANHRVTEKIWSNNESLRHIWGQSVILSFIESINHLEDVERVEDLLDDEQRNGDDRDDDGVGAEQPPPPPLLALVDAAGEAVKCRQWDLRVEAVQRVEDRVHLVPDVGQLLASEVSAAKMSLRGMSNKTDVLEVPEG